MIVGINENMTINEEPGSTYTDSTLGKISTEETIHITKINLDWSAWHYEPWFMGTNAELYIRVYEGNYSGDDVNQANWFTFGLYAPAGSNKSYKCWKWKWGWKQTKPWRTVNINTGWPENTFPSSDNFTFRLMEYDPFIYDGGIDNWCVVAGALLGAVTSGEGSVVIGPLSVNIVLIVGISTWWICDNFVLNDDMIGEINYFQSTVQNAEDNHGTEFTLEKSGRFKVKIKFE